MGAVVPLATTIVLVFALFATIPATARGGESVAPQGFETSTLRVVTDSQVEHRFTVYLAVSPRQRARGLSRIERLPPDHGMLFLFPPQQTIVMWMKDTLIPLDMLFIAPDGRVVQIERDTTPGSLRRIYADPLASAVLELNGGTADRLGIKPGARILHPSFKTVD